MDVLERLAAKAPGNGQIALARRRESEGVHMALGFTRKDSSARSPEREGHPAAKDGVPGASCVSGPYGPTAVTTAWSCASDSPMAMFRFLMEVTDMFLPLRLLEAREPWHPAQDWA